MRLFFYLNIAHHFPHSIWQVLAERIRQKVGEKNSEVTLISLDEFSRKLKSYVMDRKVRKDTSRTFPLQIEQNFTISPNDSDLWSLSNCTEYIFGCWTTGNVEHILHLFQAVSWASIRPSKNMIAFEKRRKNMREEQ